MKTLFRTLPYLLILLLVAVLAPAQIPDTTGNIWENDIRAFEQADSVQPPVKGGILFVGSSSIRMWETLKQDFPGQQVINRGFGGSELFDALYFANRIIIPYQPRIVIVYAGDNDLANGKTPERILSDYRLLVRLIHQKLPRTRIDYIAVKPSLARWNLVDKVRKTNRLIRTYSSNDRLLGFIDVFTPMLGKDGKPRKELFASDGLHLNREGYVLWTRLVRPYLK